MVDNTLKKFMINAKIAKTIAHFNLLKISLVGVAIMIANTPRLDLYPIQFGVIEKILSKTIILLLTKSAFKLNIPKE